MAIINGFDTTGKTGADLLKYASGGIDWSGMDVFRNISADDLISAYNNGSLQKIGAGYSDAKKNGYTGTVNDYKNEQMHNLFKLPYKGSGNKTIDDLNAAVGASPSGKSTGTDYLDQLLAIQKSGNAPSANMQGWADTFIDKLGKSQGGDDKETAFNRLWEDYASGNQAHATPELKSVLYQMWMGDEDGSNNGGSSVSVTNPTVYTPTYTSPVIGSGGNMSSVPNTVMGTGGVPFGSAPSGTFGDTFSKYLASIDDSGYNKQMSGSISDIEDLYKTLFGDIRTGDYTQKPYYQTILESFGVAGENAADDAVAGSVGSNGGNLDSYASANAKRQQLAFKNAAESAALDAYNAEIGNLIKTLGDMGVNVNDLYATWAQNLASERGTAADVLLGQLGADTDRYKTDVGAAVDKYLGELGLEGTKVQADADRYLGELNANLGMSQIEADKQMNADTLAAQKELAQMESELQMKLAQIEASSGMEKQRLISEASLEAARLEAEAAKYGYTVTSQTELALQQLKNESEKNAEASVGDNAMKKIEPTNTQYNTALRMYNEGGIQKLYEYLSTIPAYDVEKIYQFAIANGTYQEPSGSGEVKQSSATGKIPVTSYGGSGSRVNDPNVGIYN